MSSTELDVAQGIRDGLIQSPFKFHNVWLVNLRITGTGLAYRSSINEHVWRDPDAYLNEEFLARCNGLSVIVNHPDDLILDDSEFDQRIVGSAMLPYIKGDEVWSVCRIYSDEIVEEIRKGEVSTSPSVVFDSGSGNVLIKPDGSDETVLIEGKPYLLDHIALVTKEHGTRGVWDKNSEPEGIEISNQGKNDMTPEELQAALAAVINPVMTPLMARMDAFEKRADAAEKRADAEEAERKAKADSDEEEKAKAKADADEADAKAKADSDEKAKADADEKAKKDEEDKKRKEEEDSDDSEMAIAKADSQARADSAYSACGKRARAPMAGESVQAYRKRMVKGLQAYSDSYKSVNIDAITDDVLLGIAERQVYADAAAFINSGADVQAGTLRPIESRDSAGRKTTKFVGDIGAFLAPFQIEAQQFAGRQMNR